MSAHTELPWTLIPQHASGPMLARVIESGELMQPTKLRLIAHLLERGPSLKEDKANGVLILAAVNNHESLLDACQQQHKAIDVLMAMLIDQNSGFLPTKSPVWPAVVAGAAALRKAGVL